MPARYRPIIAGLAILAVVVLLLADKVRDEVHKGVPLGTAVANEAIAFVLVAGLVLFGVVVAWAVRER